MIIVNYSLTSYCFRVSSSVLVNIYYQNKNYIGLNRIMTFTFGQFIGKCTRVVVSLICVYNESCLT